VLEIDTITGTSNPTNASIIESHLEGYYEDKRSEEGTTGRSRRVGCCFTDEDRDWRLAASQRSNSASVVLVPNTRWR